MTTRRVTEILGSVSVEGKAYGPFQATADRPWLDVPAAVADVMGWPVHESDPSQQAQADAEEREGIHVDQILEANASLKASLDKARTELGAVLDAIGWTPETQLSPADLARNIWGASETNREQLAKATDRVRDLEAQLAAQADATPAAPGPVTLPDDLRADLIALKGISEQRADEILGMVKAALNPAPAPAPEADPQ